MGRVACVDIRDLSLTLLLHRQPDWVDHPVAVVAGITPNATILAVNARARRMRIRPGLRLAAGLSLDGDLRADVVDGVEIKRAGTTIATRLRRFSPAVEQADTEPGTFWVEAEGLRLLYPALSGWARAIHGDLAGAGFESSVAVGHTRFGTLAASRVSSGAIVLPDSQAERRLARSVPLELLGIDPKLRDGLEELGVRTVGDLLELPETGLQARFGRAVAKLRRYAAGELERPIDSTPPTPPVTRRVDLEPSVRQLDRLLFLLRKEIVRVLRLLRTREQALAALRIRLVRRDGPATDEILRPAEPTLDAVLLMELVRLRLEAVEAKGAVTGFQLVADPVQLHHEQLQLLARSLRRDRQAADRGLARVRAELGDSSVKRAEVVPGHLPEASFEWRPCGPLPEAAPVPARTTPLVRRLRDRPQPLADDWADSADIVSWQGPYEVSGGWWVREVARSYWYTETREGEILWVFWDRRRGRWFLHGTVE